MAKRNKKRTRKTYKKHEGCLVGMFHMFTLHMFRSYRKWDRKTIYQPVRWGVIN